MRVKSQQSRTKCVESEFLIPQKWLVLNHNRINLVGIRVLSGKLTNVDEAAAVNYAYNTTQIYSCSWGPRDDGRTMEAPPQIVTEAVENGIKNGRGGLGSLFVFAAGNGGGSGDNWYFMLHFD